MMGADIDSLAVVSKSRDCLAQSATGELLSKEARQCVGELREMAGKLEELVERAGVELPKKGHKVAG